jgi:hypothetical protein
LQRADEQDREARRLQAIQDNAGLYDVGTGIVRYDDTRALQDRTHEQALNTYATENNVQNTRYGQQVNAINANNQMAMDEYNNRPPSFLETAMNIGGRLGAAYLSSGMSEMGNRRNPELIGGGANPVGTVRPLRAGRR